MFSIDSDPSFEANFVLATLADPSNSQASSQQSTQRTTQNQPRWYDLWNIWLSDFKAAQNEGWYIKNMSMKHKILWYETYGDFPLRKGL